MQNPDYNNFKHHDFPRTEGQKVPKNQQGEKNRAHQGILAGRAINKSSRREDRSEALHCQGDSQDLLPWRQNIVDQRRQITQTARPNPWNKSGARNKSGRKNNLKWACCEHRISSKITVTESQRNHLADGLLPGYEFRGTLELWFFTLLLLRFPQISNMHSIIRHKL